MWHQYHDEDWGPVVLHNSTDCAVPLTWLLLYVQLTVDLIVNHNMLVNIRLVRYKDAIHVQYNIRVNIINHRGNLPGYRTVWHKPTVISNILLMSRATRKFQMVFDGEVKIFFRVILPYREVMFELSPNILYYFDSVDQESSVLLINTVSENHEVFT